MKILAEWAWFIGFPVAAFRLAPRLWRSQAYKRGVIR